VLAQVSSGCWAQPRVKRVHRLHAPAAMEASSSFCRLDATSNAGNDSGSTPSTPSYLEGVYAFSGPHRVSLSGQGGRLCGEDDGGGEGRDDNEACSAASSSCSSGSTPDDLSGMYAFDAIALRIAATDSAAAAAAAAASAAPAAAERAGNCRQDLQASPDGTLKGAATAHGGGGALLVPRERKCWHPRDDAMSLLQDLSKTKPANSRAACNGAGLRRGQRRKSGATLSTQLPDWSDPFTAAIIKQEVGSRQRGDTPVPTGKAATRRRSAAEVHEETMAQFGLMPHRKKMSQHGWG